MERRRLDLLTLHRRDGASLSHDGLHLRCREPFRIIQAADCFLKESCGVDFYRKLAGTDVIIQSGGFSYVSRSAAAMNIEEENDDLINDCR